MERSCHSSDLQNTAFAIWVFLYFYDILAKDSAIPGSMFNTLKQMVNSDILQNDRCNSCCYFIVFGRQKIEVQREKLTMPLTELVVEGYDQFLKSIKSLERNPKAQPILVIFCGSGGDNTTNWCTECVECKSIEKYIKYNFNFVNYSFKILYNFHFQLKRTFLCMEHGSMKRILHDGV